MGKKLEVGIETANQRIDGQKEKLMQLTNNIERKFKDLKKKALPDAEDNENESPLLRESPSDKEETLRDGLKLERMRTIREPGGGIGVSEEDIKPMFLTMFEEALDSDVFIDKIMSLMGTDDMKKKIKSNLNKASRKPSNAFLTNRSGENNESPRGELSKKQSSHALKVDEDGKSEGEKKEEDMEGDGENAEENQEEEGEESNQSEAAKPNNKT